MLILRLRLQSEVEETLKRIHAHKGVLGVIVVNSEGIPISTKTTWDTAVTVRRLAPSPYWLPLPSATDCIPTSALLS